MANSLGKVVVAFLRPFFIGFHDSLAVPEGLIALAHGCHWVLHWGLRVLRLQLWVLRVARWFFLLPVLVSFRFRLHRGSACVIRASRLQWTVKDFTLII
jgi:hypothetical protein